MKTENITLTKYVADEGKYFCNREQRIIASQLFLGKNDTIENWQPEIDESEKAEIEAQWEEERKAEEEKMGQEGQN